MIRLTTDYMFSGTSSCVSFSNVKTLYGIYPYKPSPYIAFSVLAISTMTEAYS